MKMKKQKKLNNKEAPCLTEIFLCKYLCTNTCTNLHVQDVACSFTFVTLQSSDDGICLLLQLQQSDLSGEISNKSMLRLVVISE